MLTINCNDHNICFLCDCIPYKTNTYFRHSLQDHDVDTTNDKKKNIDSSPSTITTYFARRLVTEFGLVIIAIVLMPFVWCIAGISYLMTSDKDKKLQFKDGEYEWDKDKKQ